MNFFLATKLEVRTTEDGDKRFALHGRRATLEELEAGEDLGGRDVLFLDLVRPEDIEQAKKLLPHLQASLENVVSSYLTHYVRS